MVCLGGGESVWCSNSGGGGEQQLRGAALGIVVWGTSAGRCTCISLVCVVRVLIVWNSLAGRVGLSHATSRHLQHQECCVGPRQNQSF